MLVGGNADARGFLTRHVENHRERVEPVVERELAQLLAHVLDVVAHDLAQSRRIVLLRRGFRQRGFAERRHTVASRLMLFSSSTGSVRPAAERMIPSMRSEISNSAA